MQTLKEAREKRGIQQKAVAEALKVSRQTYAKYEKRPELMTVCQAVTACNFIGCRVDDIFFGSKASTA